MYTTGFQFLDLGGLKMVLARAKRRDCIVLDWANHVNICFTSNWKTFMVRLEASFVLLLEKVLYARYGTSRSVVRIAVGEGIRAV
eukprot:g43447.t1